MAQTRKLGTRSTSIYTDPYGDTVVVYHQTEVVRFNASRIILNSGGWRTVTTKTRMNQAANQFGLGFRVSQKKGIWTVRMPGGFILPFRDGMNFRRASLDNSNIPHDSDGLMVLDYQW